jgi:hypothetical protein
MVVIFEVFKTCAFIQELGEHHLCDTIIYDKKLWLVSGWIPNKAEGYEVPARIVRIDTLRYHPMKRSPETPYDFYLNEPIAKWVVDHNEPIPENTQYEIDLNPLVKAYMKNEPQ